MHVDPADASAVQLPITHECDDIGVSNNGRLVHTLVVSQQLLAATPIADEEFTVDEVVAAHFVAAQWALTYCHERFRRLALAG